MIINTLVLVLLAFCSKNVYGFPVALSTRPSTQRCQSCHEGTHEPILVSSLCWCVLLNGSMHYLEMSNLAWNGNEEQLSY